MVKAVDSSVLDAALDVIATANRMDACSGDPADRAAVLTNSLANVAMAGGDYTKAAGDAAPIGRKVVMAAKNDVPITATGTAAHVTLVDATTLLLKTTCTNQALTSGNTVNFPTWQDDITGPQ